MTAVGRHTRTPIGYFTAFSGDLQLSDEPRTDRLWLPYFDRVAAPDATSILARHTTGVDLFSDSEFAEGIPSEHEFSAITPELLRAVYDGLVRSLDDDTESYAESA